MYRRIMMVLIFIMLCSCLNDNKSHIDNSFETKKLHENKESYGVNDTKESFLNNTLGDTSHLEETEYKFYDIKVFSPPITTELKELEDGISWFNDLCNIYEKGGMYGLYMNTEGRDEIYWIDDNKALYFEPFALRCIDFEDKEINTLMMMTPNPEIDEKYVWDYFCGEGYHSERFFNVPYSNKDNIGFFNGDALFFSPDLGSFTVMTYESPKIINSYSFSCDDLSFIEKKCYDICQSQTIKDFSNITLNGYITEYPSSLTKEVKLKNIFDKDRIVILGHNEETIYDVSPVPGFTLHSPSGHYWALLNRTKTDFLRHSENTPSNNYPSYIDIFDNNGKYIGEVIDNEFSGLYFRFVSGHSANITKTDLWDGEDRIYLDGRLYYANGDLVGEHFGFYLQDNPSKDYYDLMFRENPGKETLIKSNVAPKETSIVFNPSFTACVWKRDHSKIGVNQWQLP